MPNPLLVITPALELLGKNLNILPATGRAVEDLQHPDQDEIDDVLVNREMGKEITAFAETPEPSTNNIYKATPPLPRTEHHLFRFFIDGSLRTYFLATGVEASALILTAVKANKRGVLELCRTAEGKVFTLMEFTAEELYYLVDDCHTIGREHGYQHDFGDDLATTEAVIAEMEHSLTKTMPKILDYLRG